MNYGVPAFFGNRDAMPHEILLRRLRQIGELTSGDEHDLLSLPARVETIKPRHDVVSDRQKPTEVCLLIDGLLYRYKIMKNGLRQIIAISVPGDIPDLQGLYLPTLDHSLAAATTSKVAFIDHAQVRELIGRNSAIRALLWRETLIDAAIFRQWIVMLGRLNAQARLSHVICELYARLRAVGLAEGDGFAMPLTQADLADALGLSLIHISRTVKALRVAGLLQISQGLVRVPDWNRLLEFADFDPYYLNIRRSSEGAS